MDAETTTERAFTTSVQSVNEVKVFLTWLGQVTNTLHDILDVSAPEARHDILKQLDKLTDQVHLARRTRSIGQITTDAHESLRKLEPSINKINAVIDPSHSFWKSGNNKHGLLRILLKVGQMVEVFQHIEYAEYAADQGMVASLRSVTCHDAFHLKEGRAAPIQLPNVNSEFVCVKMIEIRLDYEQVMERWQFRCVAQPLRDTKEEQQLAHAQRVAQIGNEWAEYLIQEKRRQLNIENSIIWPKTRPWSFEDVLSMPVVVWISKKKWALTCPCEAIGH